MCGIFFALIFSGYGISAAIAEFRFSRKGQESGPTAIISWESFNKGLTQESEREALEQQRRDRRDATRE